MTKLIIFTGTPGSGKSTILSHLQEKGVVVLNMGTEMQRVLEDKGKNLDRDKLRLMSGEDTLKTRMKVIKKIIDSKKDSIIDTHASIKQGNRYVPGFSIEELRSIRVKGIIYIDAKSEDILKRRKADTSRYRGDLGATEAEIDEHRTVNISILAAFALHLGIPLYIVENQEKKLEETVKDVDRIVKELFGGLGRQDNSKAG
ncbi:MAG: AAA family ATPase [Candidatus Micrarchaeota archaeon]|nr:AAA family ATPase [Candidatus Micrarchaeota archaeon]